MPATFTRGAASSRAFGVRDAPVPASGPIWRRVHQGRCRHREWRRYQREDAGSRHPQGRWQERGTAAGRTRELQEPGRGAGNRGAVRCRWDDQSGLAASKRKRGAGSSGSLRVTRGVFCSSSNRRLPCVHFLQSQHQHAFILPVEAGTEPRNSWNSARRWTRVGPPGVWPNA